MNVTIPPPPPTYNSFSLTQAFEAIRRAFISSVSQDEAAPRILLRAEDGRVYDITVNNTGATPVISIVLNDGKSRL
jgi:hypothetical protein